MNFSCKNCNIAQDMHKIKSRLENLISNNNKKLCSNEIVKLSQLLDNFVYKCTFCSENLAYSNNSLQITYSNNSNYLNDQHFWVSLYYYIIQGLKKNQLIFLSMDRNLYNDILYIAKKLNLPTKHLKFRSVKETILWHSSGGLAHLQKNIKYLAGEKDMTNYSGFRWISHPKYAIENTSLKDFYKWEMDLGKALDSVNPSSSLDFVYKKYDIKIENNYIDEPIINTSMKLDSYHVDDNTFKGLEYEFKN